ncbi:MAG: CHAT domain-containing protein [Marinilabiliales bacterium]|nr:MAG: CHAT domain-containing protein [Marinilabiliales bacterium]
MQKFSGFRTGFRGRAARKQDKKRRFVNCRLRIVCRNGYFYHKYSAEAMIAVKFRFRDHISRTLLRTALMAVLLPAATHGADAIPESPGSVQDSSRIYNNLGIDSYQSGNFEQAEYFFKRELDIKRRELGAMSSDMVSTYSNLGAVSRRLNNSTEAMQYYDTAAHIGIMHYGNDHRWLGAVYQNQANLLREQGDFARAHTYYDNALRIFIMNDLHGNIGTLYNNKGIALERSGDLANAKNYYLQAIEIRREFDPDRLYLPLLNLANCHAASGDTVAADEYYRLAVDAAADLWGSGHINLAPALMNYGIFLVSDSVEPARGFEKLMRALEIYRSQDGDKGPHLSMNLLNIGYYYEVTGNREAALQYYQESLVANSTTFSSADPRVHPGDDDHVFAGDIAINSLRHKALAFYNMSYNGNRREMLEESLLTFQAAIALIERMRTGYHSEESRMILAANEHEVFMHALHVSEKLYRLTGERKFLETAFSFSERSKASGLLASIRNIEARAFGGVPEELIAEEQSLSRRLAAYRELIHEEQRLPEPDNGKILLWQERIFSLEKELLSLINRLEEEYPGYHALKYNPETIPVDKAMGGLGSRDAMVSYVYNDSVVHIFALTNRDARFWSVPTGNQVEGYLDRMLEVLSGGNIERNVTEDFNTFFESSRFFYRLLLERVIEFTGSRRLIIVPDGILSYLPFELLLTSDSGLGGNNYRILPYLLRDLPVSYSYSATLWKESRRKSTLSGRRVLAMAPGYEYSEGSAGETASSRQYYRDKLVPLPGAREEAMKVAALMEGKVLLDNEATEDRFKQIAGEFDLLHFAMHTLIDDDNPMFSKLVFADTGTGTGREDGLLNTYEIYNLELNAGLAVLSSCRSGYGTINRGEGVMSLARGFLYAGVPSIVMTHWEIEDKSGAEIMIGFYRYLLRGHRKDEALRRARIDFIENADLLRSHPYFWGAYVCIGDPDRLFGSFRHYYPVVTFVLFTLLIIFAVWRGFFFGKRTA